MVVMNRRIQLTLAVLLALTLLLTACGKASPSATQTPTESPTPAITATSTVAPGRLVYVTSAPADTDPYAALVSEFAAASSLEYVPSTVLDASVLTPDAKIVVLQSVPADLGAVLDANPKVQFVLLGSSELTGKSNLSTVSARPEDVYFMAGYLSTLIANDWRSAGLFAGNTPLAPGASQAFINGGRYVCGKCNPSYPPVVDLPQVTTLPADSPAAYWLSSANDMLLYGVNVMFLDSAAATPEVLSTLAADNVSLIGITAPPAGYESIWAATLTSDASAALQQVLEAVLKGQGGQTVTVPVALTNVNSQLVTPARQDLFTQVAGMVAAGEIGTQSIP